MMRLAAKRMATTVRMLGGRRQTAPRKKPIDGLAAYSFLVAPYVLLLAALYLWSFWGAFGIDILAYLDVGDIVKAAAAPLAATASVLILGATLGHLSSSDEKEPSSSGLKLVALIKRYPLLSSMIYLLVLVGLHALWGKGRWYVISLLASIPGTVILIRLGLLAEVRNQGVRTVVLFSLSALPFLSLDYAEDRAQEILQGTRFTYLVSPIEGLGPVAVQATVAPRFIGHAGERYFFFLSDGSIAIVDKDQAKTLVLASFDSSRAAHQTIPPASPASSSAGSSVRPASAVSR